MHCYIRPVAALAIAFFVYAWPAFAEMDSDKLEQLEKAIDAQEKRLEESERQRRRDADELESLREEVERLKTRADDGVAPDRSGAKVEPERLNVFNPRVTVFGNALWRIDDRKVTIGEDGDEERIDDTVNLREAEVDFRAAIDPYADGLLIVTLESEVPGEFEVGVEEGYAEIKHLPFLERPPFGLRIKVGRFRPELGRINRLHLHDLPQVTRPLAVEAFLGPEGYVTTGVSGRFLLPSPVDEDSAWELYLEVLQGGSLEIADNGTRDPALLGNLRWSRIFGAEHFGDLSAIVHYGRSDEAGDRSVVTYSLDGLYKWQPLRGGQWRSFLLGGQLFYADREFDEERASSINASAGTVRSRRTTPLGAFAFAQLQLNRSLFAGLRGDWVQDIADESRERWAIHPYVSYYLTEFLRLRLGYEHRWSDLQDEDKRNSVFTELNFIFGSHPPEPFWVNR